MATHGSSNHSESDKSHLADSSPSSAPTVTESDWDFKLATLFSIFESTSESVLHQALVAAKGDLEDAIPLILSSESDRTRSTSSSSSLSSKQDWSRSTSRESLASNQNGHIKKKQRLIQPRLDAFLPPTPASLASIASQSSQSSSLSSASSLSLQPPTSTTSHHSSVESTAHLPSLNDRLRWRDTADDSTPSSLSNRPKPLVLYNPEDVAKHCPCTLIFNVLDKDLATRLLGVMLKDSETWNRNRWWLFERMVESPHKTSYFVDQDVEDEVGQWTYNGKKQDAPKKFLPEMNEAKLVVRRIVNELRKSRTIARVEYTQLMDDDSFERVRHPYEEQGDWNCNVAAVNHYAHSKESVGWHADKLTYLGPRPTIGSLTLGATRFFRIRKVQEEWKHEIPAQATVTPHPVSGTARINITYRLRREGFSPAETPVCKCGVAMVLRCVFKNKANYGKYFYMCYGAGSQEGRTCGEFHWVDMEERLHLATNKVKEESEDQEGVVREQSKEVSKDTEGSSASSSSGSESAACRGETEITVSDGDPQQQELDVAKELEDDEDLFSIPLEALVEDDLFE
ncbi:hypothetical protein BGZ70_005346 [Mortierella alpina]|uniref:GRF-type domain-containing protein n=1 Tax=Mortierella alpina TaxID=64518 RepID=A0A9P6J950_MORAP|nr:hypothetical protein BGZ70_005346 [Mortierella alpina]